MGSRCVGARHWRAEAVLNGAVISATEGSTASYAIYTYNNGSVVGNAGKYNIYGNILNNQWRHS